MLRVALYAMTSDKHRIAELNAELDRASAEIARLREALAHALAFIEHAFPFDGEPCDAFEHATDGGPVMDCNLKMMRDALARKPLPIKP